LLHLILSSTYTLDLLLDDLAMTPLDAFLLALPETLRDTAAACPDLADRLENLQGQAHTTWPDVTLSTVVVMSALAERWTRRASSQALIAWLDKVNVDDLYVAIGCLEHNDQAMNHFDAHWGPDLRRLAKRYAKGSVDADDLFQTLQLKLLVGGPKRPPKLRDYDGLGRLKSWLRVTAVRTFIDQLRRRDVTQDATELPEERVLAIPEPSGDIELDFLKREYRAQFKAAFADAVESLEPRERNLLRQYFVAGLTVTQLGALYGFHASTASRHISRARQALLDATRKGLIKRLNIDQDEFESLVALIRSRLDLSMSRLLAPKDEGT